ncbi:hypothetical protein JQ594_00640 [Bradyrhizobium manausense]|uniref:hypothetical protein n=1 Tax=Bradyrhizobium manausense TaxID=989370 RepID=UPI001BA79C76|nr:hypothetical protein [Bradyrhizobium manausense]MBR0684410.1 hypothetical protein [Bradyrhizobium manausense]
MYLGGTRFLKIEIDEVPGFRQTKSELELALAPLANSDEHGLGPGGAVARSIPTPHFPELSQSALIELACQQNGECDLPIEVLQAIRTALRSGKSVQDVADHYQILNSTIYDFVRTGFPSAQDPILTSPSTRQATIDFVELDPSCTSSELAAWINTTFGTGLTATSAWALAKSFGLHLGPCVDRAVQTQAFDATWGITKAAIQVDPILSNSEIAEIIENETGVRIPLATLNWRLIRRPDLPDRAKRRGPQFRHVGNELSFAATFEQAWPALKYEIAHDPGLSNRELCLILEGETGTLLSKVVLVNYLNARNDVPQRSIRRGKVFREHRRKRAAFDSAWPKIRAQIVRNPALAEREIVNLVAEDTGAVMTEPTITRYLRSQADLPNRAPMRGAKYHAPGNSLAGNPRKAFELAWPVIKAELEKDPSRSDPEIIEIITRETGMVISTAALSSYLVSKDDIPHRNDFRGPQSRISGQPSTMIEPLAAFDKAWPVVRQQMLDTPTLSASEIATIIEAETGRLLGVHLVRKYLAKKSDAPARSSIRGSRFVRAAEAFHRAWPVVKARMAEDPSLSDMEISKIIEAETSIRITGNTVSKHISLRPDAPRRDERRGPHYRHGAKRPSSASDHLARGANLNSGDVR